MLLLEFSFKAVAQVISSVNKPSARLKPCLY